MEPRIMRTTGAEIVLRRNAAIIGKKSRVLRSVSRARAPINAVRTRKMGQSRVDLTVHKIACSSTHMPDHAREVGGIRRARTNRCFQSRIIK